MVAEAGVMAVNTFSMDGVAGVMAGDTNEMADDTGVMAGDTSAMACVSRVLAGVTGVMAGVTVVMVKKCSQGSLSQLSSHYWMASKLWFSCTPVHW